MTRLLSFCLLVLVAAAQPGRMPDRVLRTETVTAHVTGWEFGDYLWAQVSIGGRPAEGVQPGPDPIGPFLEAHRGGPFILTIQTVSTWVPEAGGMTEIRRISAARQGRLSAARWWQSLSAAQRRRARDAYERAIQ